ncbi:MAG: hypothetical protein NPINA01_22040 [Nitrospinaceae bacterium]|nr:MAG: hypothetical protein NPINA01_22040 [Nitrospinaceae bacterium]
MNLNIKQDEFILLLTSFLDGKVSPTELTTFAWDGIDYFSDTPKKSATQGRTL